MMCVLIVTVAPVVFFQYQVVVVTLDYYILGLLRAALVIEIDSHRGKI